MLSFFFFAERPRALGLGFSDDEAVVAGGRGGAKPKDLRSNPGVSAN